MEALRCTARSVSGQIENLNQNKHTFPRQEHFSRSVRCLSVFVDQAAGFNAVVVA